MSVSLSLSNNPVSNYLNDLPRNTKIQSLQCFTLSFVISTSFSNSLVCGAVGGVLGAMAVVVDSLVRTIMDKIFEGYSLDPDIKGYIHGGVLVCIIFGTIPLGASYLGLMKTEILLKTAFINLVFITNQIFRI